MPEPTPVPARRRRRWLGRLIRWCLGLAGVGLVLLAVAATWLWRHQTEAANEMLARLPMPAMARAKKVRVTPVHVTLKDVTLNDPVTGRQWLKLDEVTWTPAWKDLPRFVLGSVHVKGARVDLDRATLAALTQSDPAAPAGSSSAAPGVFLDKLTLENVHLKVAALGTTPAFECTLDQHVTGLDLSDALHPAVKSLRTSVREVAVGDAGEVKVSRFNVEGSLGREDGVLRVSAFECVGGELTPSKTLLDLLVPSPTAAASTGPSPIRGVELSLAKLQDFELHAASREALPVWWPQVKGRLSGTVKGLSWSAAGGLKLGRQDIEVTNLDFKPPAGPGGVSWARAQVTLESGKDGAVHVIGGELEKPVFDWTPELEAWLMPPSPAPVTPAAAPARWAVSVDAFAVHDAALALQRTPAVGYEGRAHLDLHRAALSLRADGWASAKPQRLAVRDLSLAEHPASKERPREPFARLEAGSLQIVPDDWKASCGVAEFTLTKPVVRLRSDNVSWFDEKPPVASVASAPEPAPTPTPGEPWFKRLHFDRLAVNAGDLDLAMTVPQAMELRTKVTISTGDKDHIHRLDLRQVKGLLPHLAKLPVAGIDKLELAVQLPSLWQTTRIDALKIKGMEVEVGDALMTLGKEVEQEEEKEQAKEAATAPKTVFVGPPEPSPLSNWRVNQLAIEDVAVTLQQVAPGLPPMKFDITYDAIDVPLDPDELAGNLKPQRIELTQLGIKSPYNSLREVARLDTVFVEFTLDGLFKQRIDQIEIVSPTLYVGEDLFWYIDYYRKYAAGETLPKAVKDMAATGSFMALEAATAAAEAPVKQAHAWTIDTLKVHAGKLIIAPKGVPLPGIPRPFPFSFVSKLDKGQIDAEFDIPSDTYTWEELKLALEGMSGHVLFNLPVKGQDNNLTETFNVDRIRFKQLHLEKAHLSVTYDVNGIYGKFGGAAYEGYLNGAFNVYLDQSFSWDGWISGIGVRSTEITQKISPAYFLLDGKVDLTLVAQGNMNELYQCDVKFTNPTSGTFSIQALNDALKALPSDAARYQQDIMRIGVETVRDFKYDKVDGECRFYGREGKGHLRFLGPTGSRNIELNVYDHRWNPVKAPSPPATPAIHDSAN